MSAETTNAAISCQRQRQRVLIDGEAHDSGREILERREFGRWWNPWADLRACNTPFIREIAFEAWQAARRATG